MIEFRCKALESKNLTRLRSKLLDGKFSASVNTTVWKNENSELCLAQYTVMALKI